MHIWLVFLHIASAFIFVLAHGASAAVALKLRRESDSVRIRALLELSGSTLVASGVSVVMVLVTGIALGFTGHWWGTVWIWASLVLLVLIGAAMSIMGSAYFNEVRAAVGLPSGYGGDAPPEQASPAELEALLRSWRPVAVSVIGVVGLLVILWLMTLKPF